MGIEALTHRDDGTSAPVPASERDWQEWVSATDIRNWALGDPLIDWLELYGHKLEAVARADADNYEPDLDFAKFVSEKAAEFRDGIRSLLADRYQVATIGRSRKDARRLDRARETFAAMVRGVPVIHRATLRDAEHRIYGAADLLIRSDVLRDLFPQDLSDGEAAIPAPHLGSSNWHYRVVNVRYMTLRLNAAGTQLGNAGNAARKAELYILNRMLGRLQGFLPPASYLLGRGWRREQRGETFRGDNALERLGAAPQDGSISRDATVGQVVEQALEWVRRLRREGASWELLPSPSVPELYPNMTAVDSGDLVVDSVDGESPSGGADGETTNQWVSVKKHVAAELKELTQLWRVGVSGRRNAHARGIFRWDDPDISPEAVSVNGQKHGPVLERLLMVNNGGPPALPAVVKQDRELWHEPPGVEFFVDFEYCSDLNDDFSSLPQRGGQALIFMIGCGHVENGEWVFRSFFTESLTLSEEARIIGEWIGHMRAIREQLEPKNAQPRIFHWSHAETIAYRDAQARHGAPPHWGELGWYDFPERVMRQEPVVIRGALNFGLKSVARAMRQHGFIETEWDENNPVDGLGAMVGAWRCDAEAQRLGVAMGDLPLAQRIVSYNEVDCKAMMEIVRYLRTNH